eukprot:CAMPEP_0115033378 /NCGR_PEP_ID=MMETSP0216-20121206/39825_1 /TAXON_ID=223996 /ORGANISM="Protocruzia adherens, Strain Boccale" /LENGTH=65 /DNA_ID=CAMNT_0002411671 /DNA_START=16 /DNA_END=209 /DNA_ORIENTATION=-
MSEMNEDDLTTTVQREVEIESRNSQTLNQDFHQVSIVDDASPTNYLQTEIDDPNEPDAVYMIASV